MAESNPTRSDSHSHVFDPVTEMCGCGMGRNGQVVDWNANRALAAAVTRTLTMIEMQRDIGKFGCVDCAEVLTTGPGGLRHCTNPDCDMSVRKAQAIWDDLGLGGL